MTPVYEYTPTMKTITKPAGIATLITMCALSTQAAMLPGSEPKDWPADPSSHVVKIERVITKADDAKWIAAAESLPADAAALREAAKKQDKNAAVVAKQWWYMESVNVKIPFALTGDAVTYYSDLVTGFGKQAMKRYSKPGSNFTYSASVSHHAEFTVDEKKFQNVTVVTLSMEFSENFAATTTEAMNFSKQRVIVFDKDSKALYISGDGETQAPVMAI
jgi:hypothetical protein